MAGYVTKLLAVINFILVQVCIITWETSQEENNKQVFVVMFSLSRVVSMGTPTLQLVNSVFFVDRELH